MEIIILISVASTLGIVAVVGAIVVAFKKLNNKVDNEEIGEIYRELENITNRFNQELEDVSRGLSRRVDENQRISDSEDTRLSLDLSKRIDDLDNDYDRKLNGIYDLIDSRYGKLYDLIKNKKK